jgi:hypothetical protein
VATGDQDARIDGLAAHVRAAFGEPFFLAIHHEPEDDVDDRPDSGMAAADYAAMFAHTVRRLRTDGVTNAVTVMAYMGSEKWPGRSWWPRLYPGDDVTDWIALDSYLRARPGYHYGDFTDLLQRTADPRQWPGYYTWATTAHPDKPFMLAEWGVLTRVPGYPTFGVPPGPARRTQLVIERAARQWSPRRPSPERRPRCERGAWEARTVEVRSGWALTSKGRNGSSDDRSTG